MHESDTGKNAQNLYTFREHWIISQRQVKSDFGIARAATRETVSFRFRNRFIRDHISWPAAPIFST